MTHASCIFSAFPHFQIYQEGFFFFTIKLNPTYATHNLLCSLRARENDMVVCVPSLVQENDVTQSYTLFVTVVISQCLMGVPTYALAEHDEKEVNEAAIVLRLLLPHRGQPKT